MGFVKSASKCLAKFFLVFTGLLTILFLFQLQAVKHGLIPVMAAGSVTPDVILFNVLALIPLGILSFWSFIETRWPDLYITSVKYKGVRYLVDLTRWRAAFIASLASLTIINVVL